MSIRLRNFKILFIKSQYTSKIVIMKDEQDCFSKPINFTSLGITNFLHISPSLVIH